MSKSTRLPNLAERAGRPNPAWLCFFVGLCLAWSTVTQAQNERALNIQGGKPTSYRCGPDALITARYYHLSDNSLSFVKLTFPNGQEYTLPQALSASGARYTDGREIEWWIKGDAAFVEKRNLAGEWKPLYPTQCKQAPEPSADL